MEHLRKVWNNFKAQPEIWFFYGFLLTSILSVRKVLTDHFIAGAFNEYTGVYIYLSDMFLIATLVVWIVSILYNKNMNLSISRLIKVPRRTFLVIVVPLFLVGWSFLSIKWSNEPQIAVYRSFKLFEFYLLYLFLVVNRKCSTWNILKNVFRIIIFIGVINSLIGILQFTFQHSLGLFWLKESLISPDLPGIAKIVLDGTRYVRAYGLFPHPNILGGFLLLSIILTFTYKKIFTISKNVSRSADKTKMFPVEHFSSLQSGTFLPIVLGIQIVGEILTFSKSAILGLILAIIYLLYNTSVSRLPSEPKMFSVEHFRFLRGGAIKKMLLMGTIILLAIYIIHPDLSVFFMKSLNERLLYIDIAKNMIFGNFLAGTGVGQFVVNMQNYSSLALLDWQFQPVHNVILLIWSELGLTGLGIFIYFLWELFLAPIVPREKIENDLSIRVMFRAILLGFLVISLFDHYLWDIQQGQIMLWTGIGLLAGAKFNT